MIKITKEEFLEATGINLSLEINSVDDNTEQAVTRTLNLWARRILDLIIGGGRGTIDDSKLTTTQVEAIKRAQIEYGMYYLKNGDLYYASGYEEGKGLTVAPAQLIAIQMPVEVEDILRHAGLIRRSIGVTRRGPSGPFFGW